MLRPSWFLIVLVLGATGCRTRLLDEIAAASDSEAIYSTVYAPIDSVSFGVLKRVRSADRCAAIHFFATEAAPLDPPSPSDWDLPKGWIVGYVMMRLGVDECVFDFSNDRWTLAGSGAVEFLGDPEQLFPCRITIDGELRTNDNAPAGLPDRERFSAVDLELHPTCEP
jgi:hypothetical protein